MQLQLGKSQPSLTTFRLGVSALNLAGVMNLARIE
jgi:hypothetical protein